MMLGYWHRPDETRRVKEADGWLHTGDQARIEDGRIIITGRIKNILVTSTGEKIAPVDLETAILAEALVVLNAEAWEREKDKLGAGGRQETEAETAFLLKRIADAVKSYPAYATPLAVWWTLEPWTIAAGLLTPTLKNKRAGLEHRFAAEIEQIYARRPPTRSRSADARESASETPARRSQGPPWRRRLLTELRSYELPYSEGQVARASRLEPIAGR